MTVQPPEKISFVLHFNRSVDARWTGRLQEVAEGTSRPFVVIETLVEELGRHGVHLKHDKPASDICTVCKCAGATTAKEV